MINTLPSNVEAWVQSLVRELRSHMPAQYGQINISRTKKHFKNLFKKKGGAGERQWGEYARPKKAKISTTLINLKI